MTNYPQPESLTSDDKVTYISGASSSHGAPRLDLVPRELMTRAAQRFTEGLEKYGEGNYRKGFEDPGFMIDRFNHAQVHLDKLLAKYKDAPSVPLNSGDDDLGALIWFVAMLAERDTFLSKVMNDIPF